MLILILKENLPEKSTVNTVVLNIASQGMRIFPVVFCLLVGTNRQVVADLFGVHRNTVSKANNAEGRELSDVRTDAISRDRMWQKRQLLSSYFSTIKVSSGMFSLFFLLFIIRSNISILFWYC